MNFSSKHRPRSFVRTHNSASDPTTPRLHSQPSRTGTARKASQPRRASVYRMRRYCSAYTVSSSRRYRCWHLSDSHDCETCCARTSSRDRLISRTIRDMKARADSPGSLDSCASLPATKVDPVNAIGASIDISAGQWVAATTMREAPSRETHPSTTSHLPGHGGTRRNGAGRLRVFAARHAARADLAPHQPSTIFG